MSSKCKVGAVTAGFLPLSTILARPLPGSPAYSGSIIGQIAGVSRDSFSLQVREEGRKIFVDFLIGPATRIDGQLKVGANAGVEYMSLGNCNFATHVMTDAGNPLLADD